MTGPTEGLCFGFALVHAAMDSIGQLDWWENVLIKIATWDGNFDSLKQHINIGSIPTTLEEILHRTLCYIIDSQAIYSRDYFFSILQRKLLQPDAYVASKPASKTEAESEIKRSYFEILDEAAKDSKIKTIKTRQIIAGNFTKEQLMSDLQNMPETAILLVHAQYHTIRLYRKGANWGVYNPNYDHTKKETIHKIGSLSECIDEIMQIQGTAIAIEVASYDEHAAIAFPAYDKLLQTSPISLIKNFGLSIMATNTPQVLAKFFQQISNSVEAKQLLKVIIQELPRKDEEGWTTFQVLANFVPDALFELVKLIDNSSAEQYYRRVVLTALCEKMGDGEKTAFSLIEADPDLLLKIMQSVTSVTGTEEENQILLTQSINAVNHCLDNGSDRIPFMNVLLARRNGLDVFLKELSKKIGNQNKTQWQHICDESPDLKRQITSAIRECLLKMNNEQLLAYGKEIRRALKDKNAKYRGICKQSAFFHGQYVKTELYQCILKTIDETMDSNHQATILRHNKKSA